MWHVGQKVVCINGKFSGAVWDWCDRIPEEGCIYSIRGLSRSHHFATGIEGLGILLNEIINPKTSHGIEATFCASRFAPYEESLTHEKEAEELLSA